MELKNEKKEILNGIYSQISSFDNKSGLLISVLGIVFGLSLDFFEIFSKCSFVSCDSWFLKAICYIALVIYCIAFIFSIGCFVCVITPRFHNGKRNNVNYYKDICGMTLDEFNSNIKEYCENDSIIDFQIFANACICNRKHLFLRLGICGLIPYGVTMLFFIAVNALIFL